MAEYEAVDLDPKDREVVIRILDEHVPGCEVRAYGSRVKWRARQHSDLDMAVKDTASVGLFALANLRAAFEESDLPFHVDVMDWEKIPENFRKEILSKSVVLQKAGPGRDWSSRRLDECAYIVTDKVDPTTCNNLPYIGLEHIGEDSLQLRGIGDASEVSSTKTRFSPGDVLFGKLRPYFRKVVQPNFTGICSTDIWVARPLDAVSQEYLFYLMASSDFVDFASAGSEGTRMPRAKWDHVARYSTRVPSLAAQRQITSVLKALDERIELSRRMCATLEAMASTLFRAWFVDFEPVRAKMEGRWRKGESLPGLPACSYGFFPDNFVDSELGPIPSSWRTCGLGEVADHLRETVDPSRLPAQEYALYSIPAFDAGRIPEIALGRVILSNKCIVHPGTVLLSRLNPDIERVWLIDTEIAEPAIASTEFAVLRPKSPIDAAFLYCSLRSDRYRNALVGLVTGTSKSHQRVRPQALAATTLLIPDERVLAEFSRVASEWLGQVLMLRSASQSLIMIRDTLLPKLISGEVRLPNLTEVTEC